MFLQAAFGSRIPGNMVHLRWDAQVLLFCQHGESLRQFDDLRLQPGALTDHRVEINTSVVDQFQWKENIKQEMTLL